MKKSAVLAVVMGLVTTIYAEPLLTDISTYEAVVLDDASGQTLAMGGAWDWQDLSLQTMTGVPGGEGRTIVVKCRNAAGQTIFGGTINGAVLIAPWSPFEPPDPSGEVSLAFYAENYTLTVFVNGMYYVGGMILLPAEDDPVMPAVKTVGVDIKPGSVKNPFNMRSRGLLPVAILGSVDMDVGQIDPASVKLAGLVPVKTVMADIQKDGYADMVMHFRDQDVAGVLAGSADGDVVGLELTGKMMDGTLITGTDSLTLIVEHGKDHGLKHQKAQGKKQGKGR